jgi:hypothetical protein
LDTPEEERLCHAVLGACYTTLQDFTAARKFLTLAEDQNVIMNEAYTYLSALSRLYAAILECQEAESNQQKKDDEVYWKHKLAAAEEKIEAMFTFTTYDMQGRVEGRGESPLPILASAMHSCSDLTSDLADSHRSNASCGN